MKRRGRKEAKASGIGVPPAKGDLCRKIVNQMDLPEAGSTPTMLDQVSKIAAQWFDDLERHRYAAKHIDTFEPAAIVGKMGGGL